MAHYCKCDFKFKAC